MTRERKPVRPLSSKTQKRDADATRAALLRAGEKLFAAKSFEGATFEQIAAAAKVNKALIAYHFGSKEGLYDAVVESMAADVLVDVNARIGDPRADPSVTFRNYVIALAIAMSARPSMPAILMREYLSGAMQERESPARNVLQFFRTTERLYTQGRSAGLFRDLDPHVLHLSIVGPVVHFIIASKARRKARRYARDVSDPDALSFAGALADIVLSGLRRRE